jgi:hypothetical protein
LIARCLFHSYRRICHHSSSGSFSRGSRYHFNGGGVQLIWLRQAYNRFAKYLQMDDTRLNLTGPVDFPQSKHFSCRGQHLDCIGEHDGACHLTQVLVLVSYCFARKCLFLHLISFSLGLNFGFHLGRVNHSQFPFEWADRGVLVKVFLR